MDPDQERAAALERYEDAALLAWAKVKVRSGLPEQSYSDNDRDMFILGYAACLRDVAAPCDLSAEAEGRCSATPGRGNAD